ncbi:non-heme dioxygenase in morphine synthesis N-terminal-domain-containing protein [Plectosphaerella plurivora]|uniref:Non-heme dioxygenase in morphine synthesis N-terminal-domain-containing protein n=2 Tax=Plectosphaerella TaxID=40657 RepID=A0A9P9AA43_9PEZI|nr:non-heme dioxygenase in morphine synthesis N-terminal-domain-containing protein [Plectosphaerella plurivora]KAH7363523.1 non-heme dioxygenase in morphine synthesis N-terminal-domain-containing protein [Plectosphaerella cucumerina]
MSSTTTIIQTLSAEAESFTRLDLVTAQGPAYRLVSSKQPRDARPEEVPVIDLEGLRDDLPARLKLAQTVGSACRTYGFFYIKNHVIPEAKVNGAREAALRFFDQSPQEKAKVAESKSKFSNGWSGARTRRVSPTESADVKEGFIWSYDPVNDPDPKDPSSIPDEVTSALHCEEPGRTSHVTLEKLHSRGAIRLGNPAFDALTLPGSL